MNNIIPLLPITPNSHDASDDQHALILFLYSKIISSGLTFSSVEQRCVDTYFRRVEPEVIK